MKVLAITEWCEMVAAVPVELTRVDGNVLVRRLSSLLDETHHFAQGVHRPKEVARKVV